MPTYDLVTRQLLTVRMAALISSGSSLRAASQATGVPIATAKLWLDTLTARGSLADMRREKSGRRPAVTLTTAEERALRSLVLEKRMSEEAAFAAFARHPACQPSTRAFILARLEKSHSGHRSEAKKQRWPDSLRRAAHVTAGEKDRWYGPDAARANGISTQRRLTWELNGVEMPMRPHTAWQFDDYSTNKPYYLEYADGKFRTCRQILAGLDTVTHGWLVFYHVGKERDQYTAADCLRVIQLALEGHETRPDIIILEQGRWKGNAIRGVDIEHLCGQRRRWGSIEECGIHLVYANDSRGKAEIEAGFLPLQIELEGGADIGHTRGLHERESDNAQKVNKGTRDPRLCGFMSVEESEEAHYRAAALLNARRKERQELGFASADELFAEFPVEKKPLRPEDRWFFLPHKQEATVGSIARGLVGCQVDKKKFLFVVNGIADGIHFGDGHKVLIAFDPERPQAGCAVANADMSTANRDHWRMGQLLLGGSAPLAQTWDTVPRLSIRTDGKEDERRDDEHWSLRKGALRAEATSFQAILPGGKRGLRVQGKRNRAGQMAEAISNAPDAFAESTHGSAAPPAKKPLSAESADALSHAGTASSHSEPSPAAPRLKSPEIEDDLEALEREAMQLAGVLI